MCPVYGEYYKTPPGVFGKSRKLKRLESEEKDSNKNIQYLQAQLLKLENSLDANAHLRLGGAYGNSDRWNEAMESYKQAIKIDPDSGLAHFGLGVAYHKLNMRKEAIESYKQAIKIAPDVTAVRKNLVIAYLDLDDRDSALEHYKMVKKLDPQGSKKWLDDINI